MIDKLKVRVNELINLNKDNKDSLNKYMIIKDILDRDDCFKNMDIKYAYAILRDLGIQEAKLKEVYLELYK